MKIGDRIAHHLAQLDITQGELARRLKLRPSAVSNWVIDRNAPATHRLPEIARALGMDLSAFFAPVKKSKAA